MHDSFYLQTYPAIVYHVLNSNPENIESSSSNSIEKVEVDVDVDADAEDFGPISSPTKDSSLGRREKESAISLSVPFT